MSTSMRLKMRALTAPIAALVIGAIFAGPAAAAPAADTYPGGYSAYNFSASFKYSLTSQAVFYNQHDGYDSKVSIKLACPSGKPSYTYRFRAYNIVDNSTLKDTTLTCGGTWTFLVPSSSTATHWKFTLSKTDDGVYLSGNGTVYTTK